MKKSNFRLFAVTVLCAGSLSLTAATAWPDIKVNVLTIVSAVQASLASGIVFQMDQTTPTDQGVLRHNPQRRADANLDRCVRLRLGGHRQKGIATGM